MDRTVVGLTAPYRKSDYTYQNMLLDRIKDLEAIVKKLEQRIAQLEGKK
jgi:exonuclease VII small subunit